MNHICQREFKVVRTTDTKGVDNTCVFGLDDFSPEEMQQIASLLNMIACDVYMQRSIILNEIYNSNNICH